MYKSIDKWLPSLVVKRVPALTEGKKSVFISICDHFEPFHQTHGDKSVALYRMKRWIDEFPRVQGDSLDCIGRQPRHTFFYPIEQYDKDIVSLLEEMCRNGFGETEVHLHHDGDNYNSLVDKLKLGKENLSNHHLLPIDKDSNVGFAFIHGNWAITNSHPDGKHCGVENEISALINSGCYADFTMPSAPDPCQSRIINSIYCADDTSPSRSHDLGHAVCKGISIPSNHLLFIQGPLNLNWENRKFAILPRIENSDLTLTNPPNLDRFKLWVNTNIHIYGKPDWIFVKLHTHGCNPRNIDMHLGGIMKNFYGELTEYCNLHPDLDLYFVTAREMANLVYATIDNVQCEPKHYLDYIYKSLL